MRRSSIFAVVCVTSGAALVGTWLVTAPAIGGGERRAAASSSTQPPASVEAAVTPPRTKAAGARVLGRFAVWGDVRNDAGQTATPAGFTTLVEVLRKARFTHSITVGDYILGSGDPAADTTRYDNFLDTARPLLAGRTTHWVPGNHDRIYDPADDRLYHEKLWGERTPDDTGHRLHHWGAFRMTFGTRRVYCYHLSSTETEAGEGSIGFKTATANAAADSAWRTQSRQARDLVRWLKDRGRRQWVVIVVHHPLFDAKIGDPWDTRAYSSEKMKLVRLFRRYGVDLVVQGDVHFYRRHVRNDGTTYLTQAMGGAAPKPVQRTDDEPKVPYLDDADRGHLGSPGDGHYRYGWTSFAVLSDGRLRGSTYYVSTVDEMVRGTVVPAGARILYDRFSLKNLPRTAP